MGLFEGAFYDMAVEEDATRLLKQFHGEGKAIKMPVRREAVPLDARLNEIEVLLRREAWPTRADLDADSNESEEARVERLIGRATPKQREAWRLILLVGCLREMLGATSPDGGKVAALSLEIGMGLMAVAAGNPDIEEALRSLAGEQRKANAQTALALRHAADCEAAAITAGENPEIVAIEMGDLVRDSLDPNARKILKALVQSGGHRETAARLAKVSQATVTRCIFNVLRPAFAKANHKVLPRYLMTKQELKAHGYDANAPGARDGNKKSSTHRNRE